MDYVNEYVKICKTIQKHLTNGDYAKLEKKTDNQW